MKSRSSRSAPRIIAAAAAAAVLAAIAPAQADTSAAITAPAAHDIVHTGTLELAAYDQASTSGVVNWAVRDTCEVGGTNHAGGGPNVSGVNDLFEYTTAGEFSATVDVSGWNAGQYCFIFNPKDTPTRLTRQFYIVHDYVKVGGTINTEGRKAPTHSLDGLVGDAGDAGIVGSVSVNYRDLGETVVYDATTLGFRAATGIGVSDPTAVAEIATTSGAKIIVLDRDASDSFERGAIVLRANGTPTTSLYEIDTTAGSSGAGSWVAMDRGNNHVHSEG